MSAFLASRYAEVVHRLAVGIEPRDAHRVMRVASPLELRVLAPAGLRAATLGRHGNRWSLRYAPRLPDALEVLISDPGRRYVPRRLRFPIVAEADVRAAELAGDHVAASSRTWRPALYPGASYGAGSGATGIRGVARRTGEPARWARVEARIRGTSRLVGRAHGDDRGEFLLLIAGDPEAGAEPPALIRLTVTVRAAAPGPVPPAADDPPDALWGLPLETVAPPGPDDPVCAGETLPPHYAPGFSATRDVDLVPGRIATDLSPFDLA